MHAHAPLSSSMCSRNLCHRPRSFARTHWSDQCERIGYWGYLVGSRRRSSRWNYTRAQAPHHQGVYGTRTQGSTHYSLLVGRFTYRCSPPPHLLGKRLAGRTPEQVWTWWQWRILPDERSYFRHTFSVPNKRASSDKKGVSALCLHLLRSKVRNTGFEHNRAPMMERSP